ncbi:ABC transporter ATP-binding protein [Xanthomonas vesicatoria]|uniref:ABC transporter ATP-binding protein n=1 Tax=Xanthomonas vesicatoria TaxID=56460 RepID=UPI0007322C3D|nr:ATP-binding cassette domain-containing protein [Xanthomonas vesicatoria]KTF34929.1 ABC transporter ATP-binding protein [Xanthomonas vesicatoria]MCC8557110.1 ATP-binding cassette domain-containing protein [Xanthomonas vesicatoria]MCC8602152.1 ATP-binding cassette domain-containing protein [Xanthomonas vesicatoria]MCC8611829.1 ATP-binding cassette domain-containing protein [Xanthomonas vesicatoria]MCC8674245.1 ATP-binding cassette domain-containing protein [Xanthomonas vesicatoria]
MTVATAAADPFADAPALIELDHASVMRGQVRVLHALRLRIALGQHTAILGPNGCGKSSFIKLITRELYPLARGDGQPAVKVLGQARWQVDRLRSQLGIVTGDLSVNLADMPGLDVESAVLSGFFASYVVPPHREISDDMRARAREALALARALPLLDRPYAELSAGETRRVLIARALVNRPQALLLDEPSTGLDVVARRHLLDTLRDLARQGITLVLVTHHIEEIVPEIGRVILLRAGKVVADGPRDALLTDASLSATFDGPVRVHRDGERYWATVGE